MNLDLRQAIIQNIQDKNEEQLKDMVNTAIKDHEEKTLPGLGVLFELIWQHSNDETKEELIDTLSKHL